MINKDAYNNMYAFLLCVFKVTKGYNYKAYKGEKLWQHWLKLEQN